MTIAYIFLNYTATTHAASDGFRLAASVIVDNRALIGLRSLRVRSGERHRGVVLARVPGVGNEALDVPDFDLEACAAVACESMPQLLIGFEESSAGCARSAGPAN